MLRNKPHPHVLKVRFGRGFSSRLAPHPKSLRQIGNLWFFGTNYGSADEPPMRGSFFVGNGEGIEALAKPIFVRGASPFNGSGPAAPFYGSGPAARPRPASKMDSLAWLRWAGAVRACRRGGKPPGDWQSQCACPRSFRIWSFVYIRIKCYRILSFPKALFYSLAALRIK